MLRVILTEKDNTEELRIYDNEDGEVSFCLFDEDFTNRLSVNSGYIGGVSVGLDDLYELWVSLTDHLGIYIDGPVNITWKPKEWNDE